MSQFWVLNKKELTIALLLGFFFVSLSNSQNMPKSYVAYKSSEKFVIDGRPNENSWSNAEKSDLFIDIEGEKMPKQETLMKMTWDNTYLYVFAQLSESNVWGNLKQRDTIIFYNNDFEIFIDPDGDTHNYYELEINALNTIWDLFLSKPYRNQGKVSNDWNFEGLKSAICVNGSLNHPSDIDKSWSVELAIPWSFKTKLGETTKVPENEFWRMNFSRVHWDFDLIDGKYYRKKNEDGKFMPEYNWVWSSQEVINMHEPERWGYVYFSTEDEASKTKFEIPKDEHIKWYLYELFRQYSKSKNELLFNERKQILNKIILPNLSKHESGWMIWAISPFTKNKISITDDGKLEISNSK